MTYPTSDKLVLPLEPYEVGGYAFKQRVRRRFWMWAVHLGDDVLAPPGTAVASIGAGRVVLSEMKLGSPTHRSWGGLVVVGHTHRHTRQTFYAVYGHLNSLSVRPGQTVAAGQFLGKIAAGNTPDNGWWAEPHLHFGICAGGWRGPTPPGYFRLEEFRTRLGAWLDPLTFIERYNERI